MHFDLDHAIALAGLAAPALDVETEAPRVVAARAGLGHAGEQLADGREQPGVGGRVAARRAADGALVDADDFVEVFQAADRRVRRGLALGLVQLARNGREAEAR